MRRKSHFENRVARKRQSSGAQTVSAASAPLNADAVTLLCHDCPPGGPHCALRPFPATLQSSCPRQGGANSAHSFDRVHPP